MNVRKNIECGLKGWEKENREEKSYGNAEPSPH